MTGLLKHRAKRNMVVLGLVLALVVSAVGCASNPAPSSSAAPASSAAAPPASPAASDKIIIDVGTTKIEFPKGTKPKIAYIQPTSMNAWTVADTAAAQKAAELGGVSLTVIDSGFDPNRQLSQIQNAITGKQYNALIILPLDPDSVCKLSTVDAPKANIVVVDVAAAFCGRQINRGDALWSPGTLTTVNQNVVDYFLGWLNAVVARFPGKHKVATVTGTEGVAPEIAGDIARAEIAKQYPDFEQVVLARADFTTATALAKTQDLLQAHPEVDLILSTYADMTLGIVQAIKLAGKEGKVKVAEVGAAKSTIPLIKEGSLELAAPYFLHAPLSVGAVIDAFAGKTVPRLIVPIPEGMGTVAKPLLIDKSNVDKFVPSY